MQTLADFEVVEIIFKKGARRGDETTIHLVVDKNAPVQGSESWFIVGQVVTGPHHRDRAVRMFRSHDIDEVTELPGDRLADGPVREAVLALLGDAVAENLERAAAVSTDLTPTSH